MLTAQVPLVVAAVTAAVAAQPRQQRDYQPFLLTLTLFALCYVGLGVSMCPYIVPHSITIWEAAAPENSQVFMLVGVAVLLPIILGYTAWAYWVFRGKVRPGGLSLTPPGPNPRPLARRLLWFAALWLGGVGTVTLVSYGLRLWIAPK